MFSKIIHTSPLCSRHRRVSWWMLSSYESSLSKSSSAIYLSFFYASFFLSSPSRLVWKCVCLFHLVALMPYQMCVHDFFTSSFKLNLKSFFFFEFFFQVFFYESFFFVFFYTLIVILTICTLLFTLFVMCFFFFNFFINLKIPLPSSSLL